MYKFLLHTFAKILYTINSKKIARRWKQEISEARSVQLGVGPGARSDGGANLLALQVKLGGVC